MSFSDDLIARARRVRLFICDVDGVLTDATVIMGGGAETKVFNIRDGLGLRLLQAEASIRVGWVSARPSEATIQRAQDLKVDFLHQSSGPKVAAIEGWLQETRIDWSEVLYMGDDWVDLAALKRAGLAIAPADAIEEARRIAHWVTHRPGGHGAVREAVDLLLKAQGHWERLVEKFAS
jgi:3-deoxy-D-manno-octulosonate 8-phosphate phosphatase (KDO 8-P phosphatase)